MDKCKCGARRCYTEHRPGMAKAGFDCGTYISHQGAERYSRECLFTQLAAANEKLAESARLATESAQIADSLAKDLAAANEQCERSCAEVLDWREKAKAWVNAPGVEKLTADLAAANERAGTYLGEMVRLQEALAACDESPCVWTVKPSGRDFIPGCAPETSSAEAGWRYAWSAGFVKSMTYCPHCGHKIAPLPAAPEVGK